MKDVEIKVDQILFWVIVVLLVIILAWRTFGHSPPIEAIAFALTLFGVWLSWEGWRGANRTESKLNKIDVSQAEQVQLLKGIKEILEKKL